MSTYIQDLKRDHPAKYADYCRVGGNSGVQLRNMIKVLSICTWRNTPEDRERLAAAKRLERNRY